MFPTTSQILNNYILQISVSLFALLVSVIFFGWLIKGARQDARDGKSGTRFKLFAAAGLLVWIGAAVLGYTAGELIAEDKGFESLFARIPYVGFLIPVLLAVMILLGGYLRTRSPDLVHSDDGNRQSDQTVNY